MRIAFLPSVPGGGRERRKWVAAGTYEEIMRNPGFAYGPLPLWPTDLQHSNTAVGVSRGRSKSGSMECVPTSQGIDICMPLNILVAITGVFSRESTLPASSFVYQSAG